MMINDESNAIAALLAGELEISAETLSYEDDAGRAGRCKVRVHEGSDYTVIICTEITDNPGPSITNAAPTPWQWAEDDIASEKPFIWIEHYGPESDGRSVHQFDRVAIGPGKAATWKHLVKKPASEVA